MNDYFNKIFQRRYNLSIKGEGIYISGDEVPLENDIIGILGIDKGLLNADAIEYIAFLEQDKTEINGFSFASFKWKLLAFVNMQDIFSFENTELITNPHFNRLWYFYFESKRILKEIILCCSLGFNHSYASLTRLFFEFNILQCYFYNTTKKSNNYNELLKFLDTGIRPKRSTIIKNSIPVCSHQKKLTEFSNKMYDMLSETSSHSYTPINSPFLNGLSDQQITIDNLYFWIGLTPVLDNILWMYFTNFPMSFYPKDLTIKYGFRWPLGLYIDLSNGIVNKKCLSESDYEMFIKFSGVQPEVEKLNNYYNTFPDLTESEIIDSLTKEPKPEGTILMTYLREKIKYRTMREAMCIDRKKNFEKINLTDTSVLKNVNSLTSYMNTNK